MGVVIYKLKNYVFSCVEAFQAFSADPEMWVSYIPQGNFMLINRFFRYINCVLDLARRKPQLINFFQLREELESVYNVEKYLVHLLSGFLLLKQILLD